MSKMIDSLKAKFSEFLIPSDVAESFLSEYHTTERGLLPELELSEVPSDDCFKTLQTYCAEVEETPDSFLVHKLLQIPFSEIKTVEEKLREFVDETVMQKFWSIKDIYFVNPEFIDKLKCFFESKAISKEHYSKWFINALILGEESFERTNSIFELFEEEIAKKIVSEADIWYWYSDVSGLITYLKEQGITDSRISKLLIEDPILIWSYRKEEYRRDGFLHNQEYVDNAIAKIKAGEI